MMDPQASSEIAVIASRPRWRRPRLTLLGLMTVILALGLWLGWLANSARTQRRAVAEIRRGGSGSVVYGERMGTVPLNQVFGGQVTAAHHREGWPKSWLRQELGGDYFDRPAAVRIFKPDAAKMAAIGRLPSLRVLELFFFPKDLRDEDWNALKHLNHLERLFIVGGETDAALQYLARMKSLRTLDLSSFPWDEDSFRVVGKLKQVERLFLVGGSIEGEWLAHLAAMERLQELYLASTSIGDGELVHLRAIPALKLVALRGTRVTPAGVAALKEAMPGLRVVYP